MAAAAFPGFGAGARRFFADLAMHNERAWFEATRDRYERDVLAPAAALVEDLAPGSRRRGRR